MQTFDSDRNLLFGILALQMDFISREQLVAATSAWLVDKSQALEDILLEQGSLSEADRAILAPLVERHIENHGGDPQQSLAVISSIASVREELQSLGDADIEHSLAIVSQDDQNATASEQTVTMASPDDPEVTKLRRSDGTRFRILRPHAKGGLGKVSVANDIELNREVALKEILSQYADDAESRGRFLLEAEVTGGLEHPGIVPVYGLGQYEDGRPYYAMRFIRGDSLKEATDRYHGEEASGNESNETEHHLQLRMLLGRFIDVCNAIEYAHSRGVLHRDLKPGNIMLGKYGETLVVDWGLAKLKDRDDEAKRSGETTLKPNSGSGTAPTLMGSAVGTPAYMPPEQAAGKLDELGPTCDVYSLGATLYYVLTGQPPITGKNIAEVLRKVQAGEVVAPRSLNPQVSKSLEAICLQAMSVQAQNRYASPRALADDVERYLADEPVLAFTEPLLVRVRRWIRKHPTPIAALAATILVGLISTISIATIVSGKNEQLAVANHDLRLSNEAERKATTESKEQRDRALAAEVLAKANASKAKQQEAAATKSAEEAKKVLEFFENKVLSAARPADQEGGLGIDATIRAAVDAAEPQIVEAFNNQPLVEASIRNTLGLTYWYLGEAILAIRQLERALELRIEHDGPKHLHTLTIMGNLAAAYQSAGRLDEALPLYKETFKLTKVKLGLEHPNTLTSINNLALAYQTASRLDEALPLLEETLKLTKVNLGLEHPHTLIVLGNLANAYQAAGRLNDALPLLEETLQLQKVKLGPEHPHTLIAMNNLATAYQSASRLDEALPLLEETLKLMRAKLGPEHPRTLAVMNNLALGYQAAGRLDQALPLYEETFKFMKAKLGPEHPHTLIAMGSLAVGYHDAKRWNDALPIFEELLKVKKAKLGLEDPSTLKAMSYLAFAYQSAGRLDEALPLFKELLKFNKSKLGLEHSSTLLILYRTAETLLEMDRPSDALPLYEQCVVTQRKQATADAPRFTGLLSVISRDLLKHTQYATAETYLRECLAIREKEMTNSWRVANTKSMLGESLTGQKKFEEAESLLIAGYEDLKKHEQDIPEKSKIRIPEAVQRLIDHYTARKKTDEAEKWSKTLKKSTAASEKK